VVNDRNDLDDQLYKTFSSCSKLLKTNPVQINNKKELKEKLKVSSGGIFFTTMQKFSTEEQEFELLSNRDNIIVIADEAHRTQYGFKGKLKDNNKLKFGFAKYLRDALPNASFIGFTGTPIDVSDKSTRSIFGDYIDVYDIQQAVDDKRTVKIYYESRLAKLGLKIDKKLVDDDFDDVTENEEETNKELLKSKWAALESVVGSKDRVKKIAKDIVLHFEERHNATSGKAMVVCMSRRICVELYDEIKKLKPKWVNKDDKKGLMKVVMTGSATDGPEWQEHIRNKKERSELADVFKDPESEFKLAIVRDMWLTGFDVPSLNTLYIDKPMKGHGLMQAIARVNRVFKEKTGGLIVDYLGIAVDLKDALSIYSSSGGKGKPTYEIVDAIRVMLENYNIIKDMFYKFDYKRFYSGTPRQRLDVIAGAMDHILALPDGKKRFVDRVISLSRSYALAVPSDESKEIANDVAFFIAIKNALVKKSEFKRKSTFDLDRAINQIISKAIASEDVMDIFDVAGMKKPEISILSEEFLQEVKGMKYKNLALETLQRLLHDEIKAIFRHNNIKYRRFSEMLEEALRKYYNRSIDSAKIIEELIKIAKDIKKDVNQNKELNLSPEEIAFYDALANNESAIKLLGNDVLRIMARELTKLVRQNTSVDWTLRESVQAHLRLLVKKLLNKYGYPPDKQKIATDLVLDQAKLFADEWSK
jgi:type I restriction enzyme R subunit